MISVETDLPLLIFFLLGMITLAACRNATLLSVANATCMICSVVLGQGLMIWPGLVIGTAPLYSTVAMIGVGLQLLTCGESAAYRSIGINLFALAMTLGSMFILEQALILSPLFESRVTVAGARLGSCYLVHSFFVYALCRTRAPRSAGRFLATGLVAQAIDVLVFFPSAFVGSQPLDLIEQYAMGGLLVRESVVLLSAPFLLLLIWLVRRGWVRCSQFDNPRRIPA